MHINKYKRTLTHAHKKKIHTLATLPDRLSNHTSGWCSVIRNVQARPRVFRVPHPCGRSVGVDVSAPTERPLEWSVRASRASAPTERPRQPSVRSWFGKLVPETNCTCLSKNCSSSFALACSLEHGSFATAGHTAPIARAASALLNRGVPNPNMSSNTHSPDAVRLGEKIGLVVMDRVEWERYIITSTTAMTQEDRPLAQNVSHKLAAKRPSRKGWVFYHVTQTAMEDSTFTLPGHTEENPVLHFE